MELTYKVKYSKRRTLGITVERNRTVVVHAPYDMPKDRISEGVEAKKLWIYERLQSKQKYGKNTYAQEFVSGESIMYLGKKYRLEVSNESFSEVRFEKKFLISNESRQKASSLLKTWFKERATEKILPKVAFFAQSMGITYGRIRIRDLKYRWGSCTQKGNMNFNVKLIKAPMYVIEYIVVHELAHLLENSHSTRFWNIVSVQVPYHKKARKWLLDHGDLLEAELC